MKVQLSKRLALSALLVPLALTADFSYAKKYNRASTPYDNADPKTGTPFYGGMQYQSGALNFEVKNRIDYRRVLHYANEVKAQKLPGELERRVNEFRRALQDVTEAIQDCDQKEFDRHLARLKEIRKATNAEYIGEFDRLHLMNLKYFEYEAALRSHLQPTDYATYYAKLAGTRAANLFVKIAGKNAQQLLATTEAGATAGLSQTCASVAGAVALIPSAIKLTQELWNVSQVLRFRDPAMELLELKLYYEVGLIPEFKAKLFLMDEALEEAMELFDPKQCNEEKCLPQDPFAEPVSTPK